MNRQLEQHEKRISSMENKKDEWRLLFLEGGKLSDGEIDIPYEDERELQRLCDENFIIEIQPLKNVTQ